MGMIYCRGCGQQIHDSAPSCPHCGVQRATAASPSNSATKDIPEGIKGWSWGAFLLNWIWAIGNNTWIGLLAIIPGVGTIMAVVLGVKGREWAWQNREWDSIEQFNAVQKKWSFWGVTVVGVALVVGILASITIAVLDHLDHEAQNGPGSVQSSTTVALTTPAATMQAPATDPTPEVAAAVPPPVQPQSQVSDSQTQTVTEGTGPSFDCAKAVTASEHLICSDGQLAARDLHLSQAYRQLLSIAPDKASLKKQQATWIRIQRDACPTAACMQMAYDTRIADLESAAQYLLKPAGFR